MRRYDQRNMSAKNSARAALVSNISARDRAKDVEQFDDMLKTFINEMNKFENRFGKIRYEEKMLVVKKLMRESLLNYRFRGMTMSYSELLVAPENIIIDKVATVPTARNGKTDTHAPMAASLCKLSTKELVKRRVEFWQGSELERKSGQGGKVGGSWGKGEGKNP